MRQKGLHNTKTTISFKFFAMDDLLALMEASNEGSCPSSQLVNSLENGNVNSEDTTKMYDAKSKEKTSSFSANAIGTVDPLTKIRIVSRYTSRVELVDLLSPFQFHNTTKLAFMSKYDIANLITKPSSLTGNASGGVVGKTSMATMGIVFTNSGTRISSNSGSAFTIITIGTNICIFLYRIFTSSYRLIFWPTYLIIR